MRKIVVILCLLFMVVTPLSVVASEDNRISNIKSVGTLHYTNTDGLQACIDSSDLRYLAGEVDLLESEYKSKTVDALSNVGTTVKSTNPTFNQLYNAIVHSQDVENQAIANNLSSGKQAWVEGRLITGTGADNKTHYNQGYADGMNQAMSGANISYTYNKHVDSKGAARTENIIYSKTSPGGCYVSAGHTHNKTGNCPTRYTTHVHTSACYTQAYVPPVWCERSKLWEMTSYRQYTDPDGTPVYDDVVCPICGPIGRHRSNVSHIKTGTGTTVPQCTCGGLPLNSGQMYTCNEYVNTWTLGCGKTTKTIESATISFN